MISVKKVPPIIEQSITTSLESPHIFEEKLNTISTANDTNKDQKQQSIFDNEYDDDFEISTLDLMTKYSCMQPGM